MSLHSLHCVSWPGRRLITKETGFIAEASKGWSPQPQEHQPREGRISYKTWLPLTRVYSYINSRLYVWALIVRTTEGGWGSGALGMS